MADLPDQINDPNLLKKILRKIEEHVHDNHTLGIIAGMLFHYEEFETCFHQCPSVILKAERVLIALMYVAYNLAYSRPARWFLDNILKLLGFISNLANHPIDELASPRIKEITAGFLVPYISSHFWDYVKDHSRCIRDDDCETSIYDFFSRYKALYCTELFSDDDLSVCYELFNEAPLIITTLTSLAVYLFLGKPSESSLMLKGIPRGRKTKAARRDEGNHRKKPPRPKSQFSENKQTEKDSTDDSKIMRSTDEEKSAGRKLPKKRGYSEEQKIDKLDESLRHTDKICKKDMKGNSEKKKAKKTLKRSRRKTKENRGEKKSERESESGHSTSDESGCSSFNEMNSPCNKLPGNNLDICESNVNEGSERLNNCKVYNSSVKKRQRCGSSSFEDTQGSERKSSHCRRSRRDEQSKGRSSKGHKAGDDGSRNFPCFQLIKCPSCKMALIPDEMEETEIVRICWEEGLCYQCRMLAEIRCMDEFSDDPLEIHSSSSSAKSLRGRRKSGESKQQKQESDEIAKERIVKEWKEMSKSTKETVKIQLTDYNDKIWKIVCHKCKETLKCLKR